MAEEEEGTRTASGPLGLLTRRLGPLPVWGYLVAGVGLYLVYRRFAGGTHPAAAAAGTPQSYVLPSGTGGGSGSGGTPTPVNTGPDPVLTAIVQEVEAQRLQGITLQQEFAALNARANTPPVVTSPVVQLAPPNPQPPPQPQPQPMFAPANPQPPPQPQPQPVQTYYYPAIQPAAAAYAPATTPFLQSTPSPIPYTPPPDLHAGMIQLLGGPNNGQWWPANQPLPSYAPQAPQTQPNYNQPYYQQTPYNGSVLTPPRSPALAPVSYGAVQQSRLPGVNGYYVTLPNGQQLFQTIGGGSIL